MSKMLVGAVLGMLAFATGCGSDNAVDQDSLDGRTFIATHAEGRTLALTSPIKMGFDGDQMGIDTGCNGVGGKYTALGKVLRINPGDFDAQTLVGCGAELDSQEEWIGNFLGEGVLSKLEGDTLTLSGGDQTLTLVDRDSYSKPPVEGTEWTLRRTFTDFRTGKESTPRAKDLNIMKSFRSQVDIPATAKSPRIEFQREGQNAIIFTGCNRGASDYYLRKAQKTIAIGPVFTTKMACPGKAAALESKITRFFNGIVRYSYQGPALDLVHGKKHMLFSAS